MRSLIDRFQDRCSPEPNGGCLLWTGAFWNKYGRIKTDPPSAKMAGAHRVAWELKHGQIPDGMFVCHKCDVPACVNADHLFLGTRKDNAQDALRKGRLAHVAKAVAASNVRRGQEIFACQRGHLFDATNTYRDPNGRRSCRQCRAAAQRKCRAIR